MNRNYDLVYGNEDLEHIYTYKKFPSLVGCVDTPYSDDKLYDMSFYISKKSGMLQLNPLLSLNSIYQSAHGSGTTGKLWGEHHSEFAKFILKFSPENVLEVGGFTGTLAKNCQCVLPNLKWTIIDPNISKDRNPNIHTIHGFFDGTFIPPTKYDAVVHSHLLEHMYDPQEFFKHVKAILNYGDRMIFSIPNMAAMLDRKYTNCLTFEHTYYAADYYVEYFLSKFNFKLISKQYFKEDHSIFYCVELDGDCGEIALDEELYSKNKAIFNEYIRYHIDLSKKLNDEVDKYKDTHKIYLFGSHIFSQYLLTFGLKEENIVCLLDNDPTKANKRLYGTNLISQLPIYIKNEVEPVIILKCGVYNDEIKEDILKNVNNTTVFLK